MTRDTNNPPYWVAKLWKMPSVQRSHIQLCTSSLYISTYTNPCYVLSCHKKLLSGRFFCWRCLLIRSCQKNPPNKFLPTPVCSPRHVSTHPSRNTSHLLGRATLSHSSPPKNDPKLCEECLFFPPRNHVLKENTSESSVVYRWITTKNKKHYGYYLP